MNFFGHAAVASWQTRAPGFVLGAMLPDFAAMIRARPPGAGHDALQDGVRYHHRTDEAFHDAPIFRQLSREALAYLLERGVTRGAARAVAHIGVEILLDGELARDAQARSAYRAALEAGREHELGRFVEWRDASERARFDALREGLESRGVKPEHSSPEVVVYRVTRMLADRPRLALAAEHQPAVYDWARWARPQGRPPSARIAGRGRERSRAERARATRRERRLTFQCPPTDSKSSATWRERLTDGCWSCASLARPRISPAGCR